MIRNLVVLPDGTELFSGSDGSAVISLELTEAVNTETELSPGAVCAKMIQLTLLDMGDVSIQAGDALTLYKVDETQTPALTGVFLAEKPQRNGKLLTVTAYDRLILLDKDLTLWLQQLNGWPYTLENFSRMVCQECGLVLGTESLPNGEFEIAPFSADGVTGRQLLSWASEAAGCFCRLDDAGLVQLGWYADAPVTVGPVPFETAVQLQGGALCLTLPENPGYADNALTLDSRYITCAHDGAGDAALTVEEKLLQQYYYQSALALETYRTTPTQRVQLRQSAEDVGTIFPDIETGNTLAITGNPLLSAKDAQTLLPVAQTLFHRLGGICYTPCTLELPYTPGLEAGQRLTVFDQANTPHTVYIMELTQSGKGMTLRCTGAPRRDSSFAAHRVQTQLQGKVLQLRADVDGLFVQNSDNAGKLSELSVTVEGIQGQVTEQSGLNTRLTAVEQTANSLKLSVEGIETHGAAKIKTAVGYTFDDSGLQIAREGQQMKNLLDNTGMYVTRSGQTILQANHLGVTAVDVTVGNYLIVGDHARFEDYAGGRTACFWIGG